MKILAAVDSTKHSENALKCLKGLNLGTGSEVKLVMVRRGDERKDEKETQLKAIIDHLKKDLTCILSYETLEGDPKNKILEAVKSFGAEMVLLGTRGHKGVELILLGSVSQGVLMQSPCPVLIVKADDDEDASASGFKRILLAADNSDYSQAALNWLKKFKWDTDTAFKVITVIPPLIESFEDEHTTRMSDIMSQQQRLRDAAKIELGVMAQNLEAYTRTDVIIEITEGDPREEILHQASLWNADLIVMGSHGRSGLTKLLLGSVSQAVALHSECAVAVIRGVIPKSKAMQQTGRFNKPLK